MWIMAAAVPLAAAVAAPVVAQTTRDYPVTVGKQTMMASQVEARRRAAEQKQAPRQVEVKPSTGEFVRQGKAIVYVPAERLAPGTGTAVSAELPKRRTTAPSKGRFIQRGKATIWVPNGATEPR
jgi:hypothetical protein